MATPSPTPVEPSRSRCKIEFEDLAGGQAGDLGRALAHLLQRLLLAVHPQSGQDGVRLNELR